MNLSFNLLFLGTMDGNLRLPFKMKLIIAYTKVIMTGYKKKDFFMKRNG